jgi:hypothetical protein
MDRARTWHALTAAVAVVAVALQLVLVVRGGRVLDEQEQAAIGIRLARFVAYFTVQSNILVAVTAIQLARRPHRDGTLWRALRLAAVVGITVTGVVHFLLLRPLLDLHGADYVADKLLHMAVPAVAVAGWVAFGPRPRVDARAVRLALCWPLAWLTVTLVVGGVSGWYPYPFLDHREEAGVVGVVASSAGITGFVLLLFWLAATWDRRAKVAP